MGRVDLTLATVETHSTAYTVGQLMGLIWVLGLIVLVVTLFVRWRRRSRAKATMPAEVKASQVEPQAPQKEGRMARGWRLTRAAWELMRHDRTMIALALLGAACATAGVAVIFYLGGYFSAPRHSRAHLALVSLIALYPMTFVSVFFNVALASAAGAHFDGQRMSLDEALRAAYKRIDRIALWSFLAAGIGLLLSEIANRLPGGAKLVGWLLGAAWGLATFFVVPLLALEDAGPIEALRGSTLLLKSRWGEELTGMVGIGAWTVVVAFPAAILIAIGGALSGTNPGAGITLIVIGVTALVAVSAMATATRQVFAVALFRYATDTPTGGFAATDFEHPFSTKEKGRRTHWSAYVALGLIAAFIILAAVLHPGGTPRTSANGYFHVSFPATTQSQAEIGDGIPVFYEGHRIGHVVDHWLEGSDVFVVYYVSPSLRGIPVGGPAELSYDRSGGPRIRLLR